MSFTTPRTWTYGETVTEAHLNEQIRDNENAIWVGTTAGDMDYYTSNTTKARLAAPTSYSQLMHNGTTPVWAGAGITLLAGTVLAGSVVPGGSINFSGLDQNYTNLHCMVMTSVSGTASAIGVYLNGDTGSNYAYRQDRFASSFTTSYSLNANELFYGQALTSYYSSYPSILEFDILNYSNSSLWKPAIAKIVSITGNSTDMFISKTISSFWRSTDAITSIQFCISPLFSVGTIMPNSSFMVYGLK